MPNKTKKKREYVAREVTCPACEKKTKYKMPKTKKPKWYFVNCNHCDFGSPCWNGDLNDAE